jgi:hypothetical protein
MNTKLQLLKSRKAISITTCLKNYKYELHIHPFRWFGLRYEKLYPWQQPVVRMGIVSITRDRLISESELSKLFGGK